jgi:hypothetical protein
MLRRKISRVIETFSISNVQESDESTPVPATIISVEPIGIIQLFDVKLLFAHQIIIAAHDSSQRTHKAAEKRHEVQIKVTSCLVRTTSSLRGRRARRRHSVLPNRKIKTTKKQILSKLINTNCNDVPSVDGDDKIANRERTNAHKATHGQEIRQKILIRTAARLILMYLGNIP